METIHGALLELYMYTVYTYTYANSKRYLVSPPWFDGYCEHWSLLLCASFITKLNVGTSFSGDIGRSMPENSDYVSIPNSGSLSAADSP